MKKQQIGCVAGLVLPVVLGVWMVLSISIRVPLTRIIHIETPGGPVPLLVIVFDEGGAIVKVGHDLQTHEWFQSNGTRPVVVEHHGFDPPRFRLRFPHSGAVLEVNSTEKPGEGLVLHGTWSKRYGDQTRQLPANATHTIWRDWFTTADSTPRVGEPAAFDGTWNLRFSQQREPGLIEIATWASRSNPNNVVADAEFLRFGVPNRNFHGRVSADQIRLASFDDATPCLIVATYQSDGALHGDVWMGDWYHETFTATRD